MLPWLKDKSRPIALVTGLVVINVVLVSLLMVRAGRQIPAEPITPPTTTSASPSPSRSSPSNSRSPTSSASRSESADPTKSPSTSSPATNGVINHRLLVISSADQGWRANVGDCSTPSVIERSRDGGKTWRRVQKPGLAPLTRLKVLATDTFFVVGGDSDCKAAYSISYVSGDQWERRDSALGNVWYLTPQNRNEVKAAGGRRSRPCGDHLVDLASIGLQRAAVLCGDDSVLATTDAGKNWADRGTLAGAAALGTSGNDYLAASIGASCSGVAVTRFDGQSDLQADSGVCVSAATGAKPGEVALDGSGNTVWLWSGDRVLTSADGGKTW